jgi:uncharacterized protein (DUF427 family)
VSSINQVMARLTKKAVEFMSEKKILQPSPKHPITVTPTSGRVVVTVAGTVVADSRRALTLQEADYPAAQYIPREDVAIELLERTDHLSYCPFKGDSNYYSIPLGGDRSVNAVWTYEDPYPAVAEIKDHVAFYPDRVDAISVEVAA